MRKVLYNWTNLWYNNTIIEENIMERKKNVAITGSRGFIGGHLKDRLIQDGMDVTEWDLRQDPPKSIEDFDPNHIDYVIHLAAYANVRQSIKDPQKYWKNNVENTTRIQKICHYNNIPLLYASSSCIHNWWLSPYGTTKKVNEQTAFENQVALRFTTVYGDGARENMFIPKLLNHQVEYVTRHVRDFIHVKDVIEAIICLMSKNIRQLEKAYNIGTGVGNVVEDLALTAGYTLPVKDGDACEAADNTADITEMKKLGWSPTVDVNDYIIKQTIPH
tara:strand:+ start:643 stop:1467 length:825 start_codon:yes stop_codon:yes gene_type:complete